MDKINLDITIIGGGIVGLLSAYELKKHFPEKEVALIEEGLYLGDHSTGRNSGVLHAGLYYPTNSLKHLFCIEGMQIWKKDLCPNLGIEFRECGKILFSKDKNEDQGLMDLWNKANENGVKGLEWCNPSKLKEISNFVNVESAFFSPFTGILDVTGALKKIADSFENYGGMIAKECKALSISQSTNHFKIETNQFEINSNILINAAGFNGPKLRNHLGLTNLESVLVKGNYLSTTQNLNHPHLFYPVPPKDLKGLGVHSTLDLEGKIKFGPNTEDISIIDYSDSGNAIKTMVPEIKNTFKGIDESRLYWDYSGIRSKIKDTNTGSLINDFWIKSPIDGYIECLGIESPGLTSAPAISRFLKRFL
jgi:L-2-hydroxyglutarate oxidase LhgO